MFAPMLDSDFREGEFVSVIASARDHAKRWSAPEVRPAEPLIALHPGRCETWGGPRLQMRPSLSAVGVPPIARQVTHPAAAALPFAGLDVVTINAQLRAAEALRVEARAIAVLLRDSPRTPARNSALAEGQARIRRIQAQLIAALPGKGAPDRASK